jgi:hypothetical protein
MKIHQLVQQILGEDRYVYIVGQTDDTIALSSLIPL